MGKIEKLTAQLEKLKVENGNLQKRILTLEEQLLTTTKRTPIDKILLDWHQAQFTQAAADLMLNPDPVTVHGTIKGKGAEFSIELMNLIAVKSDGRDKELILKSPIKPVTGGPPQWSVHLNSNKLDFQKAMTLVQKRAHHLIRINKSIAVNIHYYDFTKSNVLTVNFTLPKWMMKDLSQVHPDKYFDAETFQKRKIEMSHIARYIKTAVVP
jgi:hypothetical protein